MSFSDWLRGDVKWFYGKRHKLDSFPYTKRVLLVVAHEYIGRTLEDSLGLLLAEKHVFSPIEDMVLEQVFVEGRLQSQRCGEHREVYLQLANGIYVRVGMIRGYVDGILRSQRNYLNCSGKAETIVDGKSTNVLYWEYLKDENRLVWRTLAELWDDANNKPQPAG